MSIVGIQLISYTVPNKPNQGYRNYVRKMSKNMSKNMWEEKSTTRQALAHAEILSLRVLLPFPPEE